ncbi:MAG: CdaR family protein [Candidatus Binataceae bacterium]|jgi:YbbR domain-containing protein
MRIQWSKVRQALQANMGVRFVALLLAIGLWMFVNVGQRDAEVSLRVPIIYRRLPTGLMIVNSTPLFVDLTVSGPATLLSLLDPDRMTLRLDLAGVTPGEADFNIGPERFNIPRQTRVTRISPAQLRLEIDQLVTRQLPVHLNISGTVAKGYTISAEEINPPTVNISGPQHDVSQLQRVETAQLDVSGASASISRDVNLISPGRLRASVDRAQATVKVDEIIGDRKFRGIQIQVRDTNYKFSLDPPEAEVTVRGPMVKLAALKLDSAVYVDARGTDPGLHELPVRVDLSQGLELVHQTPLTAKVLLLAKRTSHHPG